MFTSSLRLGDRFTAAIYLLAAADIALLMVERNPDPWNGFRKLFLFWLFACIVPLLFAFALARSSKVRTKGSVILHSVLALFTTVLFAIISAEIENPVDTFNISNSLLVFLLALAVLALLFVSALFLLLKKQSSLATIAAAALWFYWLLLFLIVPGHWFHGAGAHREWFWVCCTAPLFLAFAAGAIPSRPTVAHVAALLGLLATPWLYWNVICDTGLGNVWLMFNTPDSTPELLGSSQIGHAMIAVLAVGLLSCAVATAALRLLPTGAQFGKSRLRELTWPSFALTLALLVVWFSRSVLPYRIPGALDYTGYPILQILHVQKHGLQFHEECVSISGGWKEYPRSVSFSGDDRKLLRYTFTETHQSGGELAPVFRDRILQLFASGSQSRRSEQVHPLRAWNADAWYVNERHSGLTIYGVDGRPAPPQQIVALFNDLETLPHSSSQDWRLRDVCLGFCFDPLSAMGYLFANHRCFDAGHGPVCR